MNEVGSRPPFFPNSPTGLSRSKTERMGQTDEVAIKRNPEERELEIKSNSASHVKLDIPEGVKDYSLIKNAVDQAQPLDRTQKLQQLKQQINDGTYHMDYDGIASKMLESEY